MTPGPTSPASWFRPNGPGGRPGVSAQPQGGAGDHDRDGRRDRGDQPGWGCRVVWLWRGGRGRGGRDGGRGAGGRRERGAGRYAQPGQGGSQLRGTAEPSGG